MHACAESQTAQIVELCLQATPMAAVEGSWGISETLF